MLTLGAGCSAPPPQPSYQLANGGRPLSGPQGVCVQIGVQNPADKQPQCYQLAAAPAGEHVEPLPLDEFGYLFPPLKPQPVLAPVTIPTPATVTSFAQPLPAIATTMPLTQPAAPPPVMVPAPTSVATPIVAAAVSSTAHFTTRSIRFSTMAPFKLNSAHLAHANRTALVAFINSLEQYHGVVSIRITGHTDRSGPVRFNQWLSQMRAKSVELRLLALGADPRSIQIRGVGSRLPRAHAHSAADNRYVDIEVVVRVPAE